MKIVFSGGGTLGPVTPLLAIKETIAQKYPEATFVWVGTKTGPEKQLVEEQGVQFFSISAGKYRRYFSLWNFFDIFKIIAAFFQSIKFLSKENPDMCISAGGFISVPLHVAAWLYGIPTWIHQQDIRVGLSNKLMAPLSTIITVAIEKNKQAFSKKKTLWIGNPVRQDILTGSVSEAQKLFHLTGTLPVVFATGGGTGSLKVNQLIAEAVDHLKGHAEVIHLSGKERPQELSRKVESLHDNYHVYEFFTSEMKHAYAAADIIVSRGGFGTLTEIAALGKPAIIIPKPGHQVENVHFLEQSKAAVFVSEKTSDGLYLAKQIKTLLNNPNESTHMAKLMQEILPRAQDTEIIRIVDELVAS